jgi:hypothetical protein
MSGPGFLPYLVCSLYSLRVHYKGAVEIYAWEESYDLAKRCNDFGETTVFRRDVDYSNRRKKMQFLDKIRLMASLPVDGTHLYLDADTTVHRGVAHLFNEARAVGFVCTQWNDWTTMAGLAHKRVANLRRFPQIDQTTVEAVLSQMWPSVNGGVFACKPQSPVLKKWEEWTTIAGDYDGTGDQGGTFIPDEVVLHVMQPYFYPDHLNTLMGGRWNCSPKYQPEGLKDEEVVIYHHHGNSCCRPEKSPRSVAIWEPIYRECMERNICGLAEWRSKIENKHLDRFDRGRDG